MNILFFDTETTGLVKNWNLPSDPRNPRMVSIGLLLCDETGQVLNTYSSIVRPEDFIIPTEASNIHGITQEFATKNGTSIKYILPTLYFFYIKADLVVAHNLKFDNIVVKHEMYLNNEILPGVKEMYCTMISSTNVCKLPAKRGGYKWPKLSEAYWHFFHEELKGAHDAMIDVYACKRIYFEGLMKSANSTCSLPINPTTTMTSVLV